ncbi:luciferase family protein [Streptomyces sp. NPDC001941]|uniref:luciferase domain-containing protein n=1 Tax=Streptomyces sp. NPDC001941 TaxID=3154659 RepID=UPI00331B95B7
MTAADRAMTRLQTWPDLVSAPPGCAVGHGFTTGECELVHFHSDNAADVHLTRTAVARLLPHLRGSSAIQVTPGAGWVTVLLDCDADVDLLLSLISVALKALGAGGAGRAADPCDWQRVPAG